MSDEIKPYEPIGCAQYSEYELAIMHRQNLRVTWRAPDGESHLAAVVPLDLETRDHEEFLIARTLDGQPLRLRLDWITHREPVDNTTRPENE